MHEIQSSHHQPVTCALYERAQGGEIAAAELVDVQDGEIEQLDDGEHVVIRHGECDLRLVQCGEDAPGGGKS